MEFSIWMAKLRESGASDISMLTRGCVKQRKEWDLCALCCRNSSVPEAMDIVPVRQLYSQVLLCGADRICTGQGLKEMFKYLA